MAELSLSADDRAWLLNAAREAIRARMSGGKPALDQPSERLTEPCGAFVTLHKGDALRGCIGKMTSSGPLSETVTEMAVSSAFHDPRFPPLTEDELDSVSIEISILSPLEETDDPSVINVGEHGIYMKRGSRSGVLLPQVAVEQNWTRKQFLENTCRKAGIEVTAWKDPRTTIWIFSAIIISE